MKNPRKGDTQGVSSQGPYYSRLCKRYMSTQRSVPPCGLSKGGTRARPNGSAPSPSTPSARALTFPPVSTPSVAPEPGRLTVPTLRSRAVLGTLLSTPTGVDHGADSGWTAQLVELCEEQSQGRATRAEAPASRDRALRGRTVGVGWTRAGPLSTESARRTLVTEIPRGRARACVCGEELWPESQSGSPALLSPLSHP